MTNQFPGATKMVLSPAAQAVLNRTAEQVLADRRINMEHIAAAALRAAAEQVVPEETVPVQRQLGIDYACWQRQDTRSKLLALATELEGANSRPQNSRYLFGVSVKDQKPPPRLV